MEKSIAFVLGNEPGQSEKNGWGWGNGYVAVPPGHPWWGIDMWESPIACSGGVSITWEASGTGIYGAAPKGWWVFGFDTRHLGDSLEEWPDEASVMAEAMKMKAQCDDKAVLAKYLKDKADAALHEYAEWQEQLDNLNSEDAE